ncbi:TetR/AcrR family transcriptional regulator [Halioglobus japonicus]|uniref:TetR/AcrR family transcriptional regulator n=1 Tax=Halioglobus japonicus TaxID=930805 RepID=UPI001F0A9A51|nr:TetR/AcrR family transcriptional regulator [Halioglobus japonicus]
MTEKTRYHHGDLRRSLLDAAAELLREEGEAGLSMRQLAARVGVSRTAPYHHFKDKQELLCAIAEEGFRRYIEVLSLDAGNLSEQRLQRFVREYLDFALDNVEYYDLMFGSRLWKSPGLPKP